MAALREAISMAQENNDHVCLQHALVSAHVNITLNYCVLYREESMAALREAISMAQENNDHVCLQHALVSAHGSITLPTSLIVMVLLSSHHI